MYLTVKQLEDAGACRKQVKKFKRLFGKRVNVTITLCKEFAQRFDFVWAADNLLNSSARPEWWETILEWEEDHCSASIKMKLQNFAVTFARLYKKKNLR